MIVKETLVSLQWVAPSCSTKMGKTKKIGHAGKFGVRYGKTIRERFNAVESKQKKKQMCPFCRKPKAKRTSKGIWGCAACGKNFAGAAYYINE